MRARAVALSVLLAISGCSVAESAPGTATNPTGVVIAVADRVGIEDLGGEDLLSPGTTVSLGDFPDQVVVLNIWGAWCGPCRGETEHLIGAHEDVADLPVAFLGIDVRDNDRDFAVDFVRDREVPYRSIYDPAARTLLKLKKYRGVAVPTTLVLDGQHRVAAFFVGGLLRSELVPVVRAVAAEQSP
ncbi:TlpA disulfide reductase family protein [Actinokineospora diospyrosa]|uniref:Thiol-disulfide isomerase or thioredoxin n=1 Tax=Actinokineospora diospyrosa TaxID=103728 RepID=A0ABT1IM71_9PSEU|nr:TlpA disulfide reductase family protein [Actinokineospora diospyrosa]MCP2273606.1 Thiol-disulfide isomerase or thioredoxin [Actinokineospora diospyrosa]